MITNICMHYTHLAWKRVQATLVRQTISVVLRTYCCWAQCQEIYFDVE